MRYLYLIFAIILINSSVLLSQKSDFSISGKDGEPSIIIHDTIVNPGELLLQVDALNFSGENGMVAAITLRIEIDTLLLDFISIQNQTLMGGWLANYNPFEEEITIIYTAPFGTGYDINGKLLDLKLDYFAGYEANLHLKPNCEISNVNLQSIDGVVYVDGSINQTSPLGAISMDSVVTKYNDTFQMPITAVGDGYDSLNKVFLRVSYDPNQIEYSGFEESALTAVEIGDENNILSISWEDESQYLNFTSIDTMLFLEFVFIGDTITTTNFDFGSKVYQDDQIISSTFNSGLVTAKLHVLGLNDPEIAGTILGDGYYFPGETVNMVAIPEDGYHFVNWTEDGDILGTDSTLSFVKQNSNDTIVAHYTELSYDLYLSVDPENSGEVTGEGNYLFGSNVTVSATPNEGYYFAYWLDGADIVSFDATYNFSMPSYDYSLTAVFQYYVYSVSTSANNDEYGSTEGDGNYEYGEDVTIIATPYEGFKFVAWTENGDIVSTDSLYTFQIYMTHEYVAYFQYASECLSPVGLFVDNLSETIALLHWASVGEEDQWDLLWGVSGFDIVNEGEYVEALANTDYLLENLSAATAYDFYVRSVCTESLKSNWEGPFTFSTWYVGIDKPKAKQDLLIYPNPVKQTLNVRLPNSKNQIVKFRVINSMGRIVKDKNVIASETLQIQLSELPAGLYILQCEFNNKLISKNFIKN